MRGYRDMVGGLRASLLLGVSTAALLAGCDWFDGNTPVSSRQAARPGAERAVAVSTSLPPASPTRQYESGIVAVDEARGTIGSVVAAKGGQKAQQEAIAKAALESDRKARVDTERRLAERKAADAEAAAAKPPTPSSPGSASPPPEPATATPSAPPPAPVTTTAIPPPTETAAAPPPAPPPASASSSQIATPPAAVPDSPSTAAVPASPAVTPVVAAAPARPVDPNKAFDPPPGWVPPGQTAPVVTTVATPPAAETAATQRPAETPVTPRPAEAAAPPPPVTPSAQVETTPEAMPVPLMPAPPTPTAVAAAPARPADPNKAFDPPPGWVPPGQTAPTASTPPVTTATTLLPASPASAPVPVTQVASAAPPSRAVTTATAAPPPPIVAEPPPPVSVAPAPTRAANPNKAFEPPPGWVPPSNPAASPTAATATSLLPSQPPPPVQSVAVASPSPQPQPEPPPAGPRRGAGESAMASSPADRPGFARPEAIPAAPSPAVTVAPLPESVAPRLADVTVPATPPANLQADIARAQSGAVPFSAIKPPPGGPVQVAVIQFGRASSGLGGRDDDILREVAQVQRRNGGTVRVVAHADQDATGASVDQIERGNYDVSRRRAINIANQLMALGVPRSAIVAEAASDSEPKYATDTARGIAANRRAEIFLDL